jgi:hypothetical protein
MTLRVPSALAAATRAFIPPPIAADEVEDQLVFLTLALESGVATAQSESAPPSSPAVQRIEEAFRIRYFLLVPLWATYLPSADAEWNYGAS